MTEEIEVTSEMIAAAINFINEHHDGEEIPMAQLLHEGYVVIETIRRKRVAIEREKAIIVACNPVLGKPMGNA
jgi:hypothetical protein